MSIIDHMSREQLLQMQSSARAYQERADSVFQEWGFRAKAPVLGQDPEDYRRDLAVTAKKQLPTNHELRKVGLRKLPQSAFDAIEPQVYNACREAASRPDSVPPGELREVVRVNPQNGHKEHIFLGRESFINDFKSPFRLVKGLGRGISNLKGEPQSSVFGYRCI